MAGTRRVLKSPLTARQPLSRKNGHPEALDTVLDLAHA
jgi:hypothetical protein